MTINKILIPGIKHAYNSYCSYVNEALKQNMDGGDIYKFPVYAKLYYEIPEEQSTEYFLHYV